MAERTAFEYDVFLSHSREDKAVVRLLAERLRKDGLKVWFDEWVLKPGDSIPAKIDEGLEHSHVLVLCMSANAFGSDWAQLEAGTFRFRDPLNKERRFIPLRLDDAPIKGSLAQFLCIDWRSADREQKYAELLEALNSPVAHQTFTGIESRTTSEWESIRGKLIKTVRQHWIDDYLRHSLAQSVRIQLGAEKAPEALDHPFSIERRSTAEVERLTEEALIRLFDKSGGSLLIQGEPGSGKTFTLVQLADLLLKKADLDPQIPVPVIVPLASWAIKQLPLEKWLGDEIHHYYNLDIRTQSGVLAEGKHLTILLDGLDEVRESVRPACLTAIRQFMDSFTGSVVLCCRTSEYASLPFRLSRGESIRLLPLTPQQIDNYLKDLKGGHGIEHLRKLVADDPNSNWHLLAATPLMLNLLAFVYAAEDYPVEAPPTQEAAREAVFFCFVRQMLHRKEQVPTEPPFTKSQAILWLQRIAKCMVKVQSTEFSIERLQPAWVQRRWKYGLIQGVFDGLIVGMVCTIAGGFHAGLLAGISVGLIVGLIGGLSRGDMGSVELARFRFDRQQLIHWLIGGLIHRHLRLFKSIRIRVDRRHLFSGVTFGILDGLIGGLGFGLITGIDFGIKFGLIVGIIFALVVGLVAGLIGGLIVRPLEMQDIHQPSEPNRGIQNSIKKSLTVAVVAGLLGGCTAWKFGHGRMGVTSGIWFGLTMFGGFAATQHYALRLALAWEGTLPFPLQDRRLIAFLDALRDRLLLKRVGSGWFFIHRQLLDYLATAPFGFKPAEVEQTLQRGKPPRRSEHGSE